MKWLAVCLALTTPGLVLAGSKPADAPTRDEPAATAQQQDDLDFDLLGEAPKKSKQQTADEKRIEEEVKARRTMLQVHQAVGFATLAGLAATVTVGQLEFNDKYRGGGDTEALQIPHLALALTTTGLFATVGLLGVLAPTPYPKKFTWDTATFHKLFMGIATAGMLTQVVLGLVANAREGSLDQRVFAQAHQIVGYVSFGAMSAGAITLFF